MACRMKDMKKIRGAAGTAMIAACVAALLACLVSDRGMGYDAYYMIAEGRDVLASGIKHVNTYTYFDGHAIVIQQWLYCVLLAAARDALGNAGAVLLPVLFGTAAFLAARAWIKSQAGPGPLPAMAAFLACALFGRGYWISDRPENATFLLLLLQCIALDRYHKTGKKALLLAPPFLAMLEANLHASMWMFHLCVQAAYLAPLPERVRHAGENPTRPGLAELASAAAIVPAALLNPYGAKALTYTADSMAVFTAALGCREQEPPRMLSSYAFATLFLLAATACMAYRKKLRTHEVWLAGGFASLGFTSYHNTMFGLVSAAVLAGPALRDAPPAAKRLPEQIRIPTAALAAAMVLMSAAVTAGNIPAYDRLPECDAVLSAMAAIPEGSACISNTLIAGALEYNGARGIFRDPRPELAGIRINGVREATEDELWFKTGEASARLASEFEGLGAYMEHHDIRIIADAMHGPQFPYLCGWASASDEWTEYVPPEDPGNVRIWIRK